MCLVILIPLIALFDTIEEARLAKGEQLLIVHVLLVLEAFLRSSSRVHKVSELLLICIQALFLSILEHAQ